MTPDQIQQARGAAEHIIRCDYNPLAKATIVANALLALTDQPSTVDVAELAEACDQYRAAYWAREDRTPGLVDDLAAPIARLRAVLALTEQPEPAQRESSLAQRIAAQCTCEYPYPREIWAGHHPNCATEQQPEPVSREELTDLAGREIDRTAPDRVAAAFSISRELLSRYTITRKQPEPEPEPSPVCDCGETVERWGQPCDACRNPVVIMEVDDA